MAKYFAVPGFLHTGDNFADLEIVDVKKYQSLIGCIQWTVCLGRFDVNTAVMTMGSFRASPWIGHLVCLKQMCGYLCKFKHATFPKT